jgi:CIC family chloride channel protein
MLGGALATALAAWLARRFAPQTAQARAAYRLAPPTEVPTAPAATVAVNYGGTALAVGTGLALGPERPAMQIGAVIGQAVGVVTRLSAEEADLLMAAAKGAGIATAFNAPLGCAAYSVETMIRRANLRITLLTLGVGATAVAVARLLVGPYPNFRVEGLGYAGFFELVLYLALGACVALVAALQVPTIAATVRLLALPRIPYTARGALVGAAIGLLTWFAPVTVGPGTPLAQSVIDGHFGASMLALILITRFVLGPISIAAGTPGGFFTPMLTLGAVVGAILGGFVDGIPGTSITPAAFAIVGMGAALATATRVPFTGVLLTIETTGAFPLLLPMTVAVFGAAFVTHALQTPSLGRALGEPG